MKHNNFRPRRSAYHLILTCFFLALAIFTQTGCQGNPDGIQYEGLEAETHEEMLEDEFDFLAPQSLEKAVCTKANTQQIAAVKQGNEKKKKFLDACFNKTGGSPWCDQLIRPNPSSVGSFQCTYGTVLPHQLIHPNEDTWTYAITAAILVEELEQRGIKICQIYNWWRPEPYNKNVGGVPGRHPFGTSVDVRFCSKNDQAKAFTELCEMRKKGRLRALGYYSSTALHLGVGDATANTWGKACN